MHTSQECIEHSIWRRHLAVAFWLTLIAAWVFLLFSENATATLVLIMVSTLLFTAKLRNDRKHYEWHLGQEKGDDNM